MTMEFNTVFDEDQMSVLSDLEEDIEDLSDDTYSALREEAISAQRIMLMRNAGQYVDGSADSAVPDPDRLWTNEKMFRLSALFEWNGGEPEDIVAAMQQKGRVRARLSAKMGTGKSTFLPFYIARKMDHRVLYVAPDVAALAQVNKYVRETGKGKFMRNWSTVIREHVCCMTYADFCAREAMTRRAALMQHFETIIFDEAFLKTPEVVAALKIFAVVATPTINLLLCSANIRTDEAGLTAVSEGSGTVRESATLVSVEHAIQSGRLISEHLTDRTMVILPNDERVADVAAYYLSEGIEVQSLDSASSVDSVTQVSSWLKGDSSTPRVLVATYRFAVAFNFPLSFVIVWPLVSECVLENDEIKWKEAPMSRQLVNQAISRVGRGMSDGAGAMVMGPVSSEEREMGLMDKLHEFVILTSCNIRPLRTKYWEECYTIFPNGLTPVTAQQIRKSNLPPYVAARYLGEDGYFAKKYANALMLFSQMGNFLMASNDVEPASRSQWYKSEVFETGGNAECYLPVKVSGELAIVLQAIEAVVAGKITLTRWQTETAMPYYDHSDYPGDIPDTNALQRRRLRRVRSFEKPAVVEALPEIKGWSYQMKELNTQLGGAGTRSAVSIPRTRFEEAIVKMKAVVPDYAVPAPEIQFVESEVGTVGNVEVVSGDMVVESPGGSVICTLPARVCDFLNTGVAMGFEDFRCVIDIYRNFGRRVVASRLFDGYSTPWSSVLLTLQDERVIQQVVRNGLSPVTYEMVGFLHGRFSAELSSTARSSNVLRKRFLKLFTVKPSNEQVFAAVESGQFKGIAQSKSFINRVLELKYWIDTVYILAEKHCVYLPMNITAAQRTLPIHARTPLGFRGGGGMIANPLADERKNPMSSQYRVKKSDYDEWR